MSPRSVGGNSRRTVCLALGAFLAVGPAAAASTSVSWEPPVEPPVGWEANEGGVVAAASAGVVVLAQISGMVASEDGNPLPGALVSVFATDSDDGAARFAVTDDEGRFEVGEASPGLYSLRAYLAGFLPSPRAQVLVRSGASLADTLLIQMAAIGSEQGSGTLSELRWLLQRGRRNVLKDRRAGLDFDNIWEGPWSDGPRFPALASLEGEFGFFAASGSSLGLPESRAVDSGIAYTRFELPSTARGNWEAEVRLMESAFASWATNLSYTMEEFDGHQFAAGIAYQRHVYGDAPDYRPPAAPILNLALLQEPQAEWDGAAFVADDFTLGRASLSTGLTYRRFSYLTGHRGLAPRAVLEVKAGDNWTLMGGMAVRVDGPIGEDSALLSRVRMATCSRSTRRGSVRKPPSGTPAIRPESSTRRRRTMSWRPGCSGKSPPTSSFGHSNRDRFREGVSTSRTPVTTPRRVSLSTGFGRWDRSPGGWTSAAECRGWWRSSEIRAARNRSQRRQIQLALSGRVVPTSRIPPASCYRSGRVPLSTTSRPKWWRDCVRREPDSVPHIA